MNRKGIKEFDFEIDYAIPDVGGKTSQRKSNLKKRQESIEKKQKGPISNDLSSNKIKANPNSGAENLKRDFHEIKKADKDSKNLWERLQKPKKNLEPVYSVMKEKKFEEELKECTFQPNYSTGKYTDLKSTCSQKISEKLYLEGLTKIQNLKKENNTKLVICKNNKLNDVGEAKPFNNKCSDPMRLAKSYKEFQKTKQDNLNALKEKYDLENKCSFHPKVNFNSEQIIQKLGNEGKKVEERLIETEYSRWEKRLHKIEEIEKEKYQDCTFKPILNINRTDCEDGPSVQGFLNRQKEFINNRDKKLEMTKEVIDSQNNFIPRINYVSHLLAENEVDLNTRLYKIPLEKSAMFKKTLSEMENEKFSFKPQINEFSRHISKTKSFKELSDNSKKIDKIVQLSTNLLNKELMKCTFKPEINKKSHQCFSKYSKLNLDEFIAEYNDKVEDARNTGDKIKEYKELKDCTFTPQINNRVEIDREKKIDFIEGVDNFMSKIELKREIENKKKQREEEVFNYGKNYDSMKHSNPTEFAPFKLSKNKSKCHKEENLNKSNLKTDKRNYINKSDMIKTLIN